MVVLPTGVFTGGIADFGPEIDKVVDQFIELLTAKKSDVKGGMMQPEPETFVYETSDYQTCLDKMNGDFLARYWGDGLPLMPPTKGRVDWLLSGTDRDPGEVLGAVAPANRLLTVRLAAIHAAMAGARPEYMPVIIAAMEAIVDPAFMLSPLQATSNPVMPVFIVNGPIASQLGISSGFGCLGPDPRHRAGACLGRATRLMMLILGDAVPGITSMAVVGQPGRFTNPVFAEAEDRSPWEPLSVERGFGRGANVLTAFNVQGTQNLSVFRKLTAKGEPTAEKFLLQIALSIGVPLDNRPVTEKQDMGLLVLNPVLAESLKDLGYSKGDVKQFLWENTRVRWSHLRDLTYFVEQMPEGLARRGADLADDALVKIADNPEQFKIVVGGGYHPTHSLWMQSAGMVAGESVSREISLPEKWEKLLYEAQQGKHM
jgi:hypothetical protein